MNNKDAISHYLTKQMVLINNMQRNHAILFKEIIRIIDSMSPDPESPRRSIKRRDVMVEICNSLMQKVREGLSVFDEDIKAIDDNHNKLNMFSIQVAELTDQWVKIISNTDSLLKITGPNI